MLLGRAATEPRVLGDELVYSGLAKGFALEGRPLLRGELDLAHSVLYPLLIAPAHVFGGDGARAFEATKAVNAVVVAFAAVPAYLLARRVVTPLFALAVALLVAFAPWTAYASLVMTESLFLPAFTTFVLLLARMLERPTVGRQLAVLACLPLLVGIRPQGVVLVGAVAGAVAINGLRAPPFRRTLLVYRPLLAGLAVGVVASVISVASGKDAPGAVSGGVLEALLDPVGLLTWSSWNVAVYGLALGVVALALYPVRARTPSPDPGRARSGDRNRAAHELVRAAAVGGCGVGVTRTGSAFSTSAISSISRLSFSSASRTGSRPAAGCPVVRSGRRARVIAVAASLPADRSHGRTTSTARPPRG